jgi:hypothetical protein
LPASAASGKCAFNMLKQVKIYSRSTMWQDRVNGFATVNFNYDFVRNLGFPSIIDEFSEKKRLQRRMLLF